MEVWNREELYRDVWEQPLIKLATKYCVSAVMIGKVCRKLQIPLPGRGYWVKKEFGKAVSQMPLPEAKDLPVLQRVKDCSNGFENASKDVAPVLEPTDPEWLKIVEVESRTIRIESEARAHKLIRETARVLKHARVDNRSILQRRFDQPCLDLRVSKGTLQRALSIMNAIIQSLEAEGFPVSVAAKDHKTETHIFGRCVTLMLVEKVKEKSRREVKESPYWTRRIIEYEPTGELEFRVGEYFSSKRLRDRKRKGLEALLPQCVGALMRVARKMRIRAEEERLAEIERQKKREERAKLAEEIAQEERKVRDLDNWVNSWLKAKQMREFIAALEKVWTEGDHDLSPSAQKGQQIVWMKQQADRIDPMRISPPSILDRKDELKVWW